MFVSSAHIASMPLLAAFMIIESIASSTVFRTSKSKYSNSSFPDSTRARSRTSLTRFNSESAEVLIRFAYSRCSSFSGVSSNKSLTPMTPFRGVHISCDIVARNSDFASFAARALMRLTSISIVFFVSVTSWPTPTIPVMLPSASRRGVAFISTSARRPCLVRSGNSKDNVFCPSSASSNTSFTCTRWSGHMNASTKLRPIASSLLYPTISAALRFHSLTRPSLSMPKIGAFAVSMSSRRSCATRFNSPSAFFRSVMTCRYAARPMMSPFSSRRRDKFSSTSMRSRPLVNSINSKFFGVRPCSASSSAPLTCTRHSGLMKSSTKSCPITSSRLYPTISIALRFHSLIRPSLSMQRIGLLAVSMSSRITVFCSASLSFVTS
mmetsp:Transcript_34729/g.55865  ORF Transcript_34729/g.55865 Transcript_34729/m.55865 type:complete len:380 (+) Transcript_34729:1059-2198(+)